MTIRHFDHTHETVAEVRDCTPNVRPPNGSRHDRRPATDPMVKYVRSIASQRSMAEDDAAEAMRYVEAHESGEKPMSFDWARGFINSFKDAPLKTRRSTTAPTRVAEDGMYRNPESGEIYKVQFPREAQGDASRLYAKLLVVVSEPERDADNNITKPAKVRFDYVSGLLKKLRPEWRMTLAEAKTFGQLYGVCCDCGRTLTREQSINAGVGPTCGADGRWAAGRETTTVLAEV